MSLKEKDKDSTAWQSLFICLRIKTYVRPNALFITSVIFVDTLANTTNNVPITQAIMAPLAICIFSGLPAATRYKIPAIIQPITTIDPPIVTAVSLSFAVISVKVVVADTNNVGDNIATSVVKNNVFLFTII